MPNSEEMMASPKHRLNGLAKALNHALQRSLEGPSNSVETSQGEQRLNEEDGQIYSLVGINFSAPKFGQYARIPNSVEVIINIGQSAIGLNVFDRIGQVDGSEKMTYTGVKLLPPGAAIEIKGPEQSYVFQYPHNLVAILARAASIDGCKAEHSEESFSIETLEIKTNKFEVQCRCINIATLYGVLLGRGHGYLPLDLLRTLPAERIAKLHEDIGRGLRLLPLEAPPAQLIHHSN